MELNINSPAYFTNHYGVDDEVYRYCEEGGRVVGSDSFQS